MDTTAVFGTLVRPGGQPIQETRIVVDLVASTSDPDAPGFIPADETEIFDRLIDETDENGHFEINLPPTKEGETDYTQDGLLYRVIYSFAGSEGIHYIDVPDSVSPVWIGSILAAPPVDIDPEVGIAASRITLNTSGFANNLSALDTTAQKAFDTLDDLIASGGGGGDVASVNGQTGIVVLTAADVGAVDLQSAGAAGSFAPLDGFGIIPDQYLPDFVSTVNGQTGAAQLDAIDIPFDATGLTGLLVGKTQLQEVAAIVDGLDFVGSGAVDSVNGQIGTVTLDAGDVGAVDLAIIGTPDGIAPLDGTGKVPTVNLPPFVASINGDTGPIDLLADMVALDDSGFTGVLQVAGAVDVQDLADAVDALDFTGAGAVDSVNSQVGVVQLNANNIPVDPSTFAGLLDSGVTDVQLLAIAVDALEFTNAVLTVNTQTGDVVLDATDVGAIDATLLNAANGVAPLDADAFVPYVNLPPLVTSLNGSLTGDVNLTGTMVAIDPSGFTTNLDNTITDVQLLAEAVDLLIPPVTNSVISVNGFDGDVVLTAADLGAVDVALIGAVDGVAPLDGAAMVPTTNLPDVVFSVNSLGGVVDLDAAAIPVDDSGFVGSLIGVTDVQGVADVLDTFTGGGGGGHTLEEAGTPLTQRTNLNFLAPFNLTDNSGADSTEVDFVPATTRTFLGVYSTTEVDTLVNTTAANVGKRVSVRVATTANITIATALNNGDTLDGITLATNDLVLVKNQTAPAENGIYVVGVSPARDSNFDTWADYPSSLASVVSGTVGALTVWLCTSNTGGTLNTTAITYSQIATGGGTMAAQNANAVAITGGSATGLTTLGVTPGTISGGALTGGDLTGSAFRANQNFTLNATVTDLSIGSPFYSESIIELDYTNPGAETPFFGPRTTFNAEGRHQYHQTVTPSSFALTSASFGSFYRFKNLDGLAMNMIPGWTYIAANVFQADNAAVTASRTDVGTFHAPFVDSTVYMTSDGGTWNGTATDFNSFSSQPIFIGNTHWGKRVGYAVKEINEYPFISSRGDIFVLAMDNYIKNYGETSNADAVNITIDQQIGVEIPRLTLATLNVGIRCDTGIQLWMDTNTTTAQPGPMIDVGGIHTINTSGIVSQGINYAPTTIYQQTAIANGQGSTIFNGQPVYKNHPSKSGSVWPYSASFLISPTYQADTNAVTAGTLQQIFARTSLARANTLGTLAVTTAEEFVAATLVGVGTSIGTRYGLHITEATGSGTVGTQIGIQIDTLAKGNVINYGIVNFNSSVLQGPIIGGFLSGQNMTLQSNGSKDGSILFDSPMVEFIVTNTTQTAAYTMATIDATVTMNVSSANSIKGFNWAPTVSFTQAGSLFGSVGSFGDSGVYKNTVGSGNIALGIITSFGSSPTIESDTATITGDYIGFTSSPTTARLISGSLTLATVSGFVSALAVGASTTVTTRTGLLIQNPAGVGTVTTNIGIDIAAQAKGATNIGFRNASTTVLTESVATVASAAAILIPTSSTIRLNNTTAGSITLTSIPHMLDGQNNQTVIIYNGSAQNVVLQDQGTLGGSNLRLMTTTVVLTPRDSVMLMYSTTVGDWIQISPIATVI